MGELTYSRGLSEATQHFTLSLPGEKEGAPRSKSRGRGTYRVESRDLSHLLLFVRGLDLSQLRDICLERLQNKALVGLFENLALKPSTQQS